MRYFFDRHKDLEWFQDKYNPYRHKELEEEGIDRATYSFLNYYKLKGVQRVVTPNLDIQVHLFPRRIKLNCMT